ncbi:uncharacterized protein A4U43_C08F2570 [Asparagus officinalis]|uniref:zinc finger with UFM1-specific peptidase domain protein n=1 Tax=Asparagus officinalis TaxID=4686 RepID=UPI00098E6189|nr:zinc finger with UFM1-specific peptidase domain protein [Asparagus officinalis]XP_020277360.1 zinc finger with UFM1-specific peptidase domain protein [Asparagus officinalis]XP_020277361.1 zinc finger with UFM1-specific peptidase domain protein [Asparagus officinalis]XP_020277362.1 zinc finger with UFM1-specific peptidase domain protein [Asparagus officinalis]XP_020277363.1 zinc finger with UFM1-specific peptidase domain protein [Asparagus officinalis]XP_020277364.1 zinc finger with UFM1-spe
MLASCPFCHIELPVTELEWHANNHLVEEELARDIELAKQISLASPSSSLVDSQLDNAEPSYIFSDWTGQTSTPCSNHSEAHYLENFDQEKIYGLVGLQIKSTLYKVEGGLMTLLKRCLESESKASKSVISGYIDHYQSVASEDSGWGCGWRNIQMMCSHLLMVRKQARDVMFGGSGFVPDIPSLQRWLEIAWERGFDKTGSNSFNQKIYGSRKWIGTTECATLLRSFGLRARIVDFDSISYSGGKRISKHVYGPMDKFIHQRKDDDFCVTSSSIGSHDEHYDLSNHLKCNSTVVDCDSSNDYKGKSMGHQILIDWVWNYFTNHGSTDNKQHVLTSEKTPLYFQHYGHSRTIVGIQKQQGKNGSQDRCSLLILDPAQRTADLERCLTTNRGWQQLIKRGVHTLRKPQYQLCYVDPGTANGEELEQLKTIDSICVRL